MAVWVFCVFFVLFCFKRADISTTIIPPYYSMGVLGVQVVMHNVYIVLIQLYQSTVCLMHAHLQEVRGKQKQAPVFLFLIYFIQQLSPFIQFEFLRALDEIYCRFTFRLLEGYIIWSQHWTTYITHWRSYSDVTKWDHLKILFCFVFLSIQFRWTVKVSFLRLPVWKRYIFILLIGGGGIGSRSEKKNYQQMFKSTMILGLSWDWLICLTSCQHKLFLRQYVFYYVHLQKILLVGLKHCTLKHKARLRIWCDFSKVCACTDLMPCLNIS